MKIAILSDIHGNHFALKSVLKEASNYDVQKFLILGDIVGYYYSPDLVLKLLSNWDCHIIKGNHEDILLKAANDNDYLELITTKYGFGHKMALQKLKQNDINFLRELPETEKLIIDNVSILLSHGSPWNQGEYVYPDSDNKLLKKFDDFSFDFIFFGHSHYQFLFKTKNGLAVNPGSVGQSRLKGGVASWAILNTKSKTIQMRETHYSTARLKKIVKSLDPLKKYNFDILNR